MRRRRPAVAAVAVAASCGLLTAAVVLPTFRPAPVSAAAGKAGATRRDDDPTVDTVCDGKGRINYAVGVIKATGSGAMPENAINPGQAKLMALGAAKADALRNLAMAVSSVRVTGESTVHNYVLQNDDVRTSVEALLKSPRVVSEKVNADGTATVVVELPMYGKESLAAVVLPQVIKSRGDEDDAPVRRPRVVRPAPSVDVPAVDVPGTEDGSWKGPDKPAIRINPPRPPARPAPLNGPEPGITSPSDNGPFSSIMIDCRGLDVEAVMSPKLYDSDGREIYGTVRVSADYAIEVGIVGYPRSMAEALRTKRCGAHPLIVRAIGVQDKFRFNPVISAADGDRILDANSHDRFLEKTAVVFLVDPIKFRKW